MRQYILFFSLLVCFASCDNGTSTKEQGDLKVKVTNGSGDDFSFDRDDSTHFFAPYPFSVGQLVGVEESPEIMIISKRLDKGSKVSIVPLAKIQLASSSDDAEETIFLATPVEEDLSIMSSSSFDDFIVSQFSLKQIVEFWYSNRYGLQGTRVTGWSPASAEDLEG